MMAMEHWYDPIDPDGSIVLLKLIENVSRYNEFPLPSIVLYGKESR